MNENIRCDQSKCLYCGGCVPICPRDSITLKGTRIEIDDSCNRCLLCLRICPVGALEVLEAKA